MQHETHPHDERLAALAGADPEVADDRALRDHVAGCERCRAVVDDLTLLRSALAELPDLRPARPLQLLPPVAATAGPRAGLLGMLRGITAPALVAGFGLILVGAVGSSGILSAFGGAASAPTFSNVGESLSAQDAATDSISRDLESPAAPASEASAAPGFQRGSPATAASTAAPKVGDDEEDEARTALGGGPDSFGGRLPWIVVLGIGVVLAGSALVVRFSVQPRTS